MNRFKDIYVMPHSHFDYGYTHPQRMMMQLQKDYLSEAVRLCLATQDNAPPERFKWTIEANEILIQWLDEAEPEEIEDLRHCLSQGLIAVTALPFHTTPLSNLPEQVDLFDHLRIIREQLDYDVRCAVNHDVNGLPWTLQQLMRQAGVDFYMTGINIHFGGIPFERPRLFLWEGPDGETIHSFQGEHYSLFSQFAHTEKIPTQLAQGASDEAIYASMREDMQIYEEDLAGRSWPKPFYILTATNPPMYDNNNPDHYLTEAVSIYNRVSEDQTIHIVTIDELRSLLQESFKEEELQVLRGDWTDYWNFGAGSTPTETRIHKHNQSLIAAAEWMHTLTAPGLRSLRSLQEAKELNLLFAEHTWGAAESVTDPYGDMTKSQRVHKDHLAWDASALAAYALGISAEKLNGNPDDFSLADEAAAVVLYNPTPYRIKAPVSLHPHVPEREGTSVPPVRIKSLLPYEDDAKAVVTEVEVPGFSRSVIPLKELSQSVQEPQAFATFDESAGILKTPYHELHVDLLSGQITRLSHTSPSGAQGVLSHTIPGGAFGVFSLARETIDPSQPNHRSTFFPRDVHEANLSRSEWNHEWKATREIPSKLKEVSFEHRGSKAVLRRSWEHELGFESAVVELAFCENDDRIAIDVRLDVRGPATPVSYYLTFPTDLGSDWIGRYDTAGVPVKLDADQLERVSKDWVSLDSYYAVEDGEHGYLLASPDARLLQPDGFGFGRETHKITRDEEPLVLSWLCNNYWDTNFNAAFSGKLNYHYILKPYRQFDPVLATQVGAEAVRPVLTTLTKLSDDLSDRTWYSFDSEAVVLQLLREENGALFIGLRNTDEEAGASCTFTLHDAAVQKVYCCGPDAGVTGALKHQGDSVRLDLAAGSLRFYRIEYVRE